MNAFLLRSLDLIALPTSRSLTTVSQLINLITAQRIIHKQIIVAAHQRPFTALTRTHGSTRHGVSQPD